MLRNGENMSLLEWLRILVIGIVEGVTEWLPVSSTGHMILLDAIWGSSEPEIMTPEFWELFEVVIQLGAILAVVTIFWEKLWPFGKRSRREQVQTIELWKKVIIGCIPAAVLGLLLDDWMDTYLYNAYVVAAMLIVYGIVFILIESVHRGKVFTLEHIEGLTYKTAFLIGCVQVLSLIPGTSRSGVTIIGGILLGCSRTVAAEFTFFLAIPVMFGASGLKLVKYLLEGVSLSGMQIAVTIVGMVVAYAVSMISIQFLMDYVKRHSFKAFGWYRIALGIVVLLFFTLVR